MTKDAFNTGIAAFLAFILKTTICSILNFDFRNSPLFSLNFFYDMSIFLVCYLICLFFISKIRKKDEIKDKPILTEDECAEYLNISIDELKNILQKDTEKKAGLMDYSNFAFISYIDIRNGEKMFNRKDLDEWVKYNIDNKETLR